jgi:hypothetical protein
MLMGLARPLTESGTWNPQGLMMSVQFELFWFTVKWNFAGSKIVSRSI